MSERKVTESLPGLSQEADEQECKALAIQLSKERLRSKTATGMEIMFWLKQACEEERNQLEMAKISQEIEVGRAKVENMKSAQHTEEMFTKAIEAMSIYSGGVKNDPDISGIDFASDI